MTVFWGRFIHSSITKHANAFRRTGCSKLEKGCNMEGKGVVKFLILFLSNK